jgi:hypothetical protein
MQAAILRMKADPASVSERLAIPKESLAKVREDSLKDPILRPGMCVEHGRVVGRSRPTRQPYSENHCLGTPTRRTRASKRGSERRESSMGSSPRYGM